MAKATYEEVVLNVLDHQIEKLASHKELDYPVINLARGKFVEGCVSFGSLALDLITGGGMPSGKMTDVYGWEGSGKSSIVYHVIAMANTLGIPVVFYDHEAGTDPIYVTNLGVKLRMEDGSPNRRFRYFQPTNGNATYRHINRICQELPDWAPLPSGGRPLPSVIFIIDSLNAMVPEVLEKDDENLRNALNASMHTDGLRLIKGLLGRKNASLLVTNQVRTNPRVMFGSPEYEPGGAAVRFYPDLKINVRAVGKPFKERGRDLRYVNVKTMKNKQFAPFRLLHKDSKPKNTGMALAFGLGVERGYDGWNYLVLTDQLEGSRGRFQLKMDGSPWDGKKVTWKQLAPLVCTNDFRAYCRGQIEDGTAFEKYFTHEDINPHVTDLEDAGDLEDIDDEIVPGDKAAEAEANPDPEADLVEVEPDAGPKVMV